MLMFHEIERMKAAGWPSRKDAYRAWRWFQVGPAPSMYSVMIHELNLLVAERAKR